MSNLINHAKYELKLAGYNPRDIQEINSDEDYSDSVANCVLELLETFSKQDHSGFSAGATLSLFNKLAKFENLSPLTDNSEEWLDMVAEGMVKLEDVDKFSRYQSKRCSSCFSKDLKTYIDNDEECNLEYEVDENGKRTGWYHRKPYSECVWRELKHVESI